MFEDSIYLYLFPALTAIVLQQTVLMCDSVNNTWYVYFVKVIEKGQKLLQLVACSSLEAEFADFMETWVTTGSEVDSELKWFVLALCIIYQICVALHYLRFSNDVMTLH